MRPRFGLMFVPVLALAAGMIATVAAAPASTAGRHPGVSARRVTRGRVCRTLGTCS